MDKVYRTAAAKEFTKLIGYLWNAAASDEFCTTDGCGMSFGNDERGIRYGKGSVQLYNAGPRVFCEYRKYGTDHSDKMELNKKTTGADVVEWIEGLQAAKPKATKAKR